MKSGIIGESRRRMWKIEKKNKKITYIIMGFNNYFF